MKVLFLLPSVFGVSTITKNKKVSCIIDSKGKNKIITKKNNINNKILDFFLIRGIYYFFVNFQHLLMGLFGFEGYYNQKENKLISKTKASLNISANSILVFIILFLSIFVSYFLLGILPIKISYFITPHNFDMFLKRLIIALIKCAIIYLALLFLKLIPAFSQYFKFNSAIKEWQDVNGKINYILYLICSVFLCVVVISVLGLSASIWYSFFVNVFVVLAVLGVNYELFKEICKNKHFKWIVAPFYFLILEKPSQKEIKCVNIVLKELENGGKRLETITKENEILFSEAYVSAKQKLEASGVYEKSDLDFIFCEVLGKNRAEIKLTKVVSLSDYKKILKAVERRASGEPCTKIFEKAYFYGYCFKVTKDVLSPRFDTEVLVEEVLKACNKESKVLDIGTGSGAIAITINKQSGSKVTAVDISEKALLVAKQNAENLGAKVVFKKSDLFKNVGAFAKFDIIVSNPPYIPTTDIDNLDKEVKDYDPKLALDGGASGYDFYEKIINEAPKKLTKNGKIFFEIGVGQAKYIKKLLQKNFKDIKIVKDFNKIERVVAATLI